MNLEICKPPKHINIMLPVTSVCNLKCTYCYIAKDTAGLATMEAKIKSDWDNGVYVNRLKTEMADDLETITKAMLWGGETLIGMPRFNENADAMFEVLPNLDNVDISTNFTLPNAVELIQETLDVLSRKSKELNRPMVYTIQISVDGPPEFNDKCRGKGTTQKILDNYKKLMNIDVPDGVHIQMSTKPTWDLDAIYDYFENEEIIRNYYQWFEDVFYTPVMRKYGIKQYNQSGISMFIGIPNFVDPSPFTKEDGIKAGILLRKVQKVSRNNNYQAYRNDSLVPYCARSMLNSTIYNASLYQKSCGGGCGQMTHCIMMMTDGLYTLCHRGAFDLYVAQRPDNTLGQSDLAPLKNWVWTAEEFARVRKNVANIYSYPHDMLRVDAGIQVKQMARSGLIDEKYLHDEELRTRFLNFYHTKSLCYYVSITHCGSNFLQNGEFLRLFLNGAFDVIDEEIREIVIPRGMVS